MTEVKHWIGIGTVDKLIEKLEEYKNINIERETVEREYRKTNAKDYSSDTYYHTCVYSFQKREKLMKEEFKTIGIEFNCADYGVADYCLSAEGAIIVLKALKRMK